MSDELGNIQPEEFEEALEQEHEEEFEKEHEEGFEEAFEELEKEFEEDSEDESEEEGEGHDLFPRFMCLPVEIRLMVWEFALPKGRILRVCPYDEDRYDPAGFGFEPDVYAPDILNPRQFGGMPLAGVCQESRNFIIDFGYERLWTDLMTLESDEYIGPWFCEGRDRVKKVSEEVVMGLSLRYQFRRWFK